MLFIVSITGGAGFLASYWFLQWGMTSLPLRYFCSFLIAYLTFIFLLWLWIQSKSEPHDSSINLDFMPDIPCGSSSPSLTPIAPFQSGAGGSYHSEGFVDSFDSKELDPIPEIPSLIDVDVDDFAIPLFVIILFISLLLCSFWIISSAPILFAELLLDGALSVGLYRHLRKIPTRHWLETALRRTALPFFVLGFIFVTTGYAIQAYSPQSKSLGELIEHWNKS